MESFGIERPRLKGNVLNNDYLLFHHTFYTRVRGLRAASLTFFVQFMVRALRDAKINQL